MFKFQLFLLLLIYFDGFSQIHPKNILFPSDSLIVFIDKPDGHRLHFSTDSINIEKKLNNYHHNLIEQGYIFNILSPQKIIKKEKFTEIYYKAQLNSIQRIDTLIFKPNKFPRNIKKNLKNKYVDEIMDSEHIKQIQKFIREFYQPEKIRIRAGLLKTKNALLIETVAGKKNYMDAYIGINNNEGKVKIEGGVQLKLFNLFNQNEKIRFDWQRNTNTQNILVQTYFPFMFGKSFYNQTNIGMMNKANQNAELFIRNSWGWLNSRQNIGLNMVYKNSISNNLQQTNLFLGVEYIYKLNNLNKKAHEFGLYNRMQNEINHSFTNENIIAYYNLTEYSQKIFSNQYLNFIHYLQGSTAEIPRLKSEYNDLFFSTHNFEENNIHKIWLLQFRYMIIYNNMILYAKGQYKEVNFQKNAGELDKSLKKTANLGIGITLKNKNQILTFEAISNIYKGQVADYLPITINIRQKIRF